MAVSSLVHASKNTHIHKDKHPSKKKNNYKYSTSSGTFRLYTVRVSQKKYSSCLKGFQNEFDLLLRQQYESTDQLSFFIDYFPLATNNLASWRILTTLAPSSLIFPAYSSHLGFSDSCEWLSGEFERKVCTCGDENREDQ